MEDETRSTLSLSIETLGTTKRFFLRFLVKKRKKNQKRSKLLKTILGLEEWGKERDLKWKNPRNFDLKLFIERAIDYFSRVLRYNDRHVNNTRQTHVAKGLINR